ncbi:MAG: creatininase family protein [Planctomycetota bacterium]
MKPWILADSNFGQVKDQKYEVAVLPLGATEPHNLHLPYGTDLFEATIVGEKICEAAHQAGAKVVLLPTIPFGTETNMEKFPLAINLNPTTLWQVISDVVESLLTDGIRKIVLLNSHGGNGMKPYLREMAGKNEAHLFLCNWYQCFVDSYSEIFENPEDHAGEMETSFGLAYFPDKIARTEDGHLLADEGSVRPTKIEAINRGWVSITRPWHLLTTNSGSGNPHLATAKKGEQMMEIVVRRLGKFLVDLSKEPLSDHFPF